jgi:pimeloyl-ACP methyl ester carboxylesterase
MKAELHQDARAGLYWRHWPRPAGKPLLALHCSLSHGGEWAGLAGARRELDVTAPDLVGHGRQPAWDGVSDLHRHSTDMAADMARRIGAGGPIDVIGHSFGGTVALRLALERPDLIRRLILVEPVLFAAARTSAVWPDYLAEHDMLEALHAKGDDAATAKMFLAIWGSGDPIESLLPALRAYMIQRIGLVMALDEDLMQDAFGLLAPGRLEALARPVLLVEGGASPPVVAAIHAELARRLPQTRRTLIPGAGHMLPVTHAPALAALVAEALA